MPARICGITSGACPNSPASLWNWWAAAAITPSIGRCPRAKSGTGSPRAHAGQGYATEVTHALTELALTPAAEGGLGFRRLEIRCDPANGRSARIPPTLGYQLDAHLINDAVAANDPAELRDTLIFSRTR